MKICNWKCDESRSFYSFPVVLVIVEHLATRHTVSFSNDFQNFGLVCMKRSVVSQNVCRVSLLIHLCHAFISVAKQRQGSQTWAGMYVLHL
jgi:hypothetical protein